MKILIRYFKTSATWKYYYFKDTKLYHSNLSPNISIALSILYKAELNEHSCFVNYNILIMERDGYGSHYDHWTTK